ncbi:MAG: hypothetical protein A3B38_04170 [Candidatus Levybacteria bacterium RIFCSPLOWO2_01_FULL_36_13]|nr:MAG: hypothetical protein A2684_01095 [Candidatus Levybacteria bacterium RIFCSPHIGHO2_01_FULL_36_15b]OGH34322.1 MAG: hypothetical protein A3B38_04170 [Candidatus Levybacteria bacterium RIFCSPLOWO2_01_FULL_36_13]
MWRLPIYILKFWYLEAPFSLVGYFLNLNKSFFNAFSMLLMVKTFFKPWKNEYREGLVKFSVFMGIIFKTLFITADVFLFAVLLFFELTFFIAFLVFPIAIFYLPFIKL